MGAGCPCKRCFRDTVFAWWSATSGISAPPPIFGWPASAKHRLLVLNLPSELTKTKSHTFPLAVSANHAAPNSAISAVHLLFIFAAWSYYWPINNLFTCGSLWQTSKHAEQRECEGAITVITLRSAIIEGCGYTDVWQHPSYRKFSQPLPARCA